MRTAPLPALLLAALLVFRPSPLLFGDDIFCADFCEGVPLLDEDGSARRRMFLNRCSNQDSFAQTCGSAETVSCACLRTSKGHRHAPGAERGNPELCKPLCTLLDDLESLYEKL